MSSLSLFRRLIMGKINALTEQSLTGPRPCLKFGASIPAISTRSGKMQTKMEKVKFCLKNS